MTEDLAYLYPTHPCGFCCDKNWLELKVYYAWKESGLPFFSIPFSVNKKVEKKCERELKKDITEKKFWLYFYYTKSSTKTKCCQLTPEKNALAGKIEYRARVIEYNDTDRKGNPFAADKDVFVISNDPKMENDNTIKKYWFKCDRFEEIKVIENERDYKVRVLTLKDFEYLGKKDPKKPYEHLQCISLHKLKSPIIVSQIPQAEP